MPLNVENPNWVPTIEALDGRWFQYSATATALFYSGPRKDFHSLKRAKRYAQKVADELNRKEQLKISRAAKIPNGI